MKRIFRPASFSPARDGTEVSGFLNPTDSTSSGLPWGLLDGMSIAAGRIAPRTRSWIHVHPAVTQVTYVVAGSLSATMQHPDEPEPYRLAVPAGSAVVTEPGTLLQLCNDTGAMLELLYIVSPPYVLEVGADAQVRHDDAVLVARDWNELDAVDWHPLSSEAGKRTARRRRARALKRMAAASR